MRALVDRRDPFRDHLIKRPREQRPNRLHDLRIHDQRRPTINVNPKNATNTPFVPIVATNVIHHGWFGNVYTFAFDDKPFTAVKNGKLTVFSSNNTINKIGINVNANPPTSNTNSDEYPPAESPPHNSPNTTSTPQTR